MPLISIRSQFRFVLPHVFVSPSDASNVVRVDTCWNWRDDSVNANEWWPREMPRLSTWKEDEIVEEWAQSMACGENQNVDDVYSTIMSNEYPRCSSMAEARILWGILLVPDSTRCCSHDDVLHLDGILWNIASLKWHSTPSCHRMSTWNEWRKTPRIDGY